MKKLLFGIASTLSLVVIGSASGLAADRPWTAATSVSGAVQPLANPAAGLKKIFSNLGSATDAYDATGGFIAAGGFPRSFGRSHIRPKNRLS